MNRRMMMVTRWIVKGRERSEKRFGIDAMIQIQARGIIGHDHDQFPIRRKDNHDHTPGPAHLVGIDALYNAPSMIIYVTIITTYSATTHTSNNKRITTTNRYKYKYSIPG